MTWSLILFSNVAILIVTVSCNNSGSKTTTLTLLSPDKDQTKRGLDNFGYGAPLNDWSGITKFLEWNPSVWTPDGIKPVGPSPAEVAHIVAAAKQASAGVILAQQHVNAAKEEVLEQQKLIKEKEAIALIAQQKSEALAAILRSEAQNVIWSQQKLAKAKSFVADLQRLASAKESEAAAAIQTSAHHASAEIHRAEQAAKFEILKRNHHALAPPHLLGHHKDFTSLNLNPKSLVPHFNAPLFSQYGVPRAGPWNAQVPVPVNPYHYPKPGPWHQF